MIYLYFWVCVALLIFSIRLLLKAKKENGNLRTELKKYEPIVDLEKLIAELKAKSDAAKSDLEESKKLLDAYQYRVDIEEMGFYKPKFVFEDVLQYREALELVREAQKELIKQKLVFLNLDGTPIAKAGDVPKIAVNAFNGESNNLVEGVTSGNFDKLKEKLTASFNKLNGLLHDSGVQISGKLLELKIKELAIAYDFKEAERRIKEEQAALKEAMKEEEEARAEAEEIRENAIAEQERYSKALEDARKELESKSAEERSVYEAKIKELEAKYTEATAQKERATAMAQITKEGHVYIISNIGSFGENVFKIGMTRRTQPEDRVRELGDAAVPFHFDIHAMIHAKDAPNLENTLHKRFDEKRLNRVNTRKEFFKTTIDDIEKACKELGHQVQLTKLAAAPEFRASQKADEKTKAA